MPRFAILTHDWPELHWDLLLEDDRRDTCRTWRLMHAPDRHRGSRAQRIADHRTMYLSYEGPVSNGRGQVTRWDAGTYELLADSNAEIRLALHGQRLSGRYRIRTPAPLADGLSAGSETGDPKAGDHDPGDHNPGDRAPESWFERVAECAQ